MIYSCGVLRLGLLQNYQFGFRTQIFHHLGRSTKLDRISKMKKLLKIVVFSLKRIRKLVKTENNTQS